MNQKDKEEIVHYLQVYFTENDGNKINRWGYSAFMNNFIPVLDKIIAADTQEAVNNQARMDAMTNKEPFPL